MMLVRRGGGSLDVGGGGGTRVMNMYTEMARSGVWWRQGDN